ncbi:MAG: hypothetical protein H7A51_07465 [Akkermansiaceae bacterium]|nr:hypothetical protein [Akkermansiaceae bacterium]
MLFEQDPIRPWFEALESMGEYIGIRFGKVDEDAGAVEWLDLPHTQYDGIGGFAKILRERGAEIESLPRIPHSVSESWWPFVKSIPAILGPRKRLTILTGSAAKDEKHFDMPPEALAWHVFSEEETALIRKAGRVLQISINSLLMRHLDRAIRQSLEDPSALATWMIPVNLRGKITREEDTSNHSSFVAVNLSASETPLDVHQQIYRRLKGGEHWANWKAYKLGKFLSPGVKEQTIKNDRGTSRWNIGGFSNLGIWDRHKEFTSQGCQGPWVFAPPVIEGIRIGAGCVTYQNRLSLMIQAHPALTTDAAITEAWMKEWVAQIQIDMATPRPD